MLYIQLHSPAIGTRTLENFIRRAPRADRRLSGARVHRRVISIWTLSNVERSYKSNRAGQAEAQTGAAKSLREKQNGEDSIGRGGIDGCIGVMTWLVRSRDGWKKECPEMVGAVPMLHAGHAGRCCIGVRCWLQCRLCDARSAMSGACCVLRHTAEQTDRSVRRDAQDDVGLACVHAGARTKSRRGPRGGQAGSRMR